MQPYAWRCGAMSRYLALYCATSRCVAIGASKTLASARGVIYDRHVKSKKGVRLDEHDYTS